MRLRFDEERPRLWRDSDKRRALLLSLTLHLGVLLLVVLLYRAPEFVPSPGYFVIDVGPPGASGGPADAALEPLRVEAPESAAEVGVAASTEEAPYAPAPETAASEPVEVAAPEPLPAQAPVPAQPEAEASPVEALPAPVEETEGTVVEPQPEAQADTVTVGAGEAAEAERPAPEPVELEPSVAELSVAEPVEAVPAELVPAPARGVEAEPAAAELLEPELAQPVVPEPVVSEPVVSEPAVPEPVVETPPSPPLQEPAEALAPVAVLPEPDPLEVALPQAEAEPAAPLEVTPEVAAEPIPSRPVDLPLPQLELAQPRDVLPDIEVEVVQPQEPEPAALALPEPEVEVAEPSPVEEVVAVEPEEPEAEVPAAEVTEAETIEAEVTEAEVVEPEAPAVEVVEPEALEPELATEPEVAEPEGVEAAEAAAVEVVVPEVLEPEPLEPEPLEADVPDLEEPATLAEGRAAPGAAGEDEAVEDIVLGRPAASALEEAAEAEPLEAELADEPQREAEPGADVPAAEPAPPQPEAAPTQSIPGPAAELAPEPEVQEGWSPPARAERRVAEGDAPEPSPPEPAAGGFVVNPLPEEPAEEEAGLPPAEAASEEPLEAAALQAPLEPDPPAAAGPAPQLPQEAGEAPQAGGGLSGTVALDPYEDQRRRPIVAILDNANPSVGRQAGLREASVIYEMPVEGDLTRLMAVFDVADPARLGPVRSARDYQHEVVEDLGGALVHSGGSPAALDAIARGQAFSFDAQEGRFGDLYNRADGAPAPYNLYSDGSRLRDYLRAVNQDRVRNLRGTVYWPAPELPEAGGLRVSYPGGYSSGFAYLRELNLYSWQRSGVSARDASGESVVVQAVVVAHVDGSPIPGDPEGRLYLALDRGGEATLYLGGKRIEGRWQQQSGFGFTAEDGQPVDLTPFKTWIMMVPSWVQLALQ